MSLVSLVPTGTPAAAEDCTIQGTTGADTIEGTSRADVICASGGADVIYGLGGDDIVYGGYGADRIIGGGGDDILLGGIGDDVLVGNDGLETLEGGDGNDRLLGGDGADAIDGSAGADVIEAGPGPDTMEGGGGGDDLSGGGGGDDLAGQGGNDTLDGGGGDDLVNGGPGINVCLNSAGDDTINLATCDFKTPVLKSFHRWGSGPFAPGDTVTIDYLASDPGSAVRSVGFSFIGPTGDYYNVAAYNDAAVDGPARAVVDSLWPSGRYELDEIRIEDNVQNFVTYWRDGEARAYPGGASGPSSHDFDFSTADFTVDNTQTDTRAPRLLSFSRRPSGTYAPGEPITIDYEATDAGSGVNYLVFTFHDPFGNERAVGGTGATGPALRELPSGWVSGRYVLKAIRVADEVPNYTTYHRNGTAVVAPKGATGPSSHDFDLSAADFTVDNPDADTRVPVLHSFGRLGPDTFTAGDTITIEYDVTDATAVDFVQFLFVGPNEGGYSIGDFDTARAGGPATVTIPNTWPSGPYELVEIEVSDPVPNSAAYKKDGTVTVYPSGADGPATHTFDFVPANFSVVPS